MHKIGISNILQFVTIIFNFKLWSNHRARKTAICENTFILVLFLYLLYNNT